MNLKTYIVPVIHHVSFGCEVRVPAHNLEQAKILALRAEAEMAIGDGYDWDRMNFERAELGNWQEIEVEESDL